MSLSSPRPFSASYQCRTIAFGLLVTQCATLTSLAVTAWLKPWASTHTQASISSSTPVFGYSLHRTDASIVSSLPSVGACSYHAAAPVGPGTQPDAFSSLDHTRSFSAFALLAPRPSEFEAFYFTGHKLGQWLETYSLLSYSSSCFVSSFFREMSKAAFELSLPSRYLAA